MKWTPLNDIVIIKVDKPEEETESGIVVRQDWKTLPPTGVVVEVGPDVPPVGITTGTRVLFERYSAIILDDDHRLTTYKHIFALER